MGQIHEHADTAYFSTRMRARQIAASFLPGFDVTRGFSKSRENTQLEFFYLKAEPSLAELIGLERELLVAYAPDPEFQARTLKVHDLVVSEDRTRLDPVGTILIGDDPDTARKVREYLVAEPERPPIVALSSAELLAIRDQNDLRRILTEQLFRRDQFALESPLRSDTTFFGRSDLVSELVDRFRSGQNSGLFGLRRIGKTSILYALGRRLHAGGIAGTAYLDVSSPAVYQLRWWQLLQRFACEIASPLDLQRGDRSKVRALTIDYGEQTGAAHFKSDILTLTSHLPDSRVALFLDEIEHITFDLSPASHWTGDFLPLWQTLRSVHQDTMGRFGYIIAGVNAHAIEADRIGSFDNPLFSTTKPFYLGPFDLPTTREMVRKIAKYMGLRFDEALFPLLHQEYGGHPFLVRQACSHLGHSIQIRPGIVSTALFDEKRSAIAVALDRNVRQILNVLAIWYPDEYEMLRLLANGETQTFVEFAQSSAAFTQHVEGYGLVRDARSDPKLSIGLVRSHLGAQKKVVVEAGVHDKEEIVVEVSRRRNRIETALRAMLRDGLRFAHGKKAMTVAISAIPDERRAVLNQFAYADVWKELYFKELSVILDKNYSDFQKRLAEDKSSVLQWLDQVNRCRVDAHAKKLCDDDLAFLRVCFRRLEDLLDAGEGA
jgi:hypothetical protein